MARTLAEVRQIGDVVFLYYLAPRRSRAMTSPTLAKLTPHDIRLAAATLYSSLEPCTRASRPVSCTELVPDLAPLACHTDEHLWEP
jgi:pyrimidine deaminase RibD-like protein